VIRSVRCRPRLWFGLLGVSGMDSMGASLLVKASLCLTASGSACRSCCSSPSWCYRALPRPGLGVFGSLPVWPWCVVRSGRCFAVWLFLLRAWPPGCGGFAWPSWCVRALCFLGLAAGSGSGSGHRLPAVAGSFFGLRSVLCLRLSRCQPEPPIEGWKLSTCGHARAMWVAARGSVAVRCGTTDAG
jgi:hypothetical protein